MTSGILVNFGWGNGLPSFWHQALTGTNVDFLSGILVTRGDFYVFVLVLKPSPVEEVWTHDNFRNKLIVQLLQNEKCSDLMLGLKQTSNLSKWFGYIFPFTFSQNSNVVGGSSPNLRIWRNSWRCGIHVTSENLTCIVVSRKVIGLRLSFIHQEQGW